MSNLQLADYAEALYAANDLDSAFRALEKEVHKLGFDDLLYSYIPGAVLEENSPFQPLFQVSSTFSVDLLSYYAEARLDRDDPLIKAIRDGISAPVHWWGSTCKSYTDADARSREVMNVSRDYGLYDGVTLPLLCGPVAIAGASFISKDKTGSQALLRQHSRSPMLNSMTRMFHNLVSANTGFLCHFTRPVFGSLNELEIQYLAGLASGKSQAEMAGKLNRSEKYLEQVMLKIRRKVSGVGPIDPPTINRNQLLYYAGLANIIAYSDKLTF
ncbi:autoinducer binding domain-containing protein [Granulosicoccus antarcticus]|uniref:Transcription factor LuxR-like autoinducer-binding domain-containing protein n=1 Tax=Granulosicoccus antarcticus IMCC3135 TaxID=1192854 RepID=A0A2Z2NHM1_9GAMM|nr:autoinducer binding domain-containing protein [Granulosicoccus antarcticus]ASJ70782.1 hypothetical protein IMCC3135_03345 [Granulosicoccus antarcticus IMCC3135]